MENYDFCVRFYLCKRLIYDLKMLIGSFVMKWRCIELILCDFIEIYEEFKLFFVILFYDNCVI